MTSDTFRRSLLCIASGAVMALALQVSTATAQSPCEMDACRTSTGNCDMTDIQASCAETTSGCKSRACEPQ